MGRVYLTPHLSSASSTSMLLSRIFASPSRSHLLPSPSRLPAFHSSTAVGRWNRLVCLVGSGIPRMASSSCKTGDGGRVSVLPLPPATADKAELVRALETTLGSSFSSEPLSPPPNPLVVVISGPSGVGKDAVIKRLQEVREGIHFVVTATSRAKRPSEIDGKDYHFVTKEKFLSMIERNELLEYALVYGEYKGVPKQQIRDFMSKGFDIVLRVDIQGAATLRSILGQSAVFIFLTAESEAALVERLIGRKTETTDMLLVRIATAREEVRRMKDFDYVVVNAEGQLDNAVQHVESIIDAEKAKIRRRSVSI